MRVDKAKAAAALALLGLLLTVFAFQPGVPPQASGAANSTSSPPLSLGFGPSSLSPVSGGTPVYTVGETIWAESGYNYSLALSLAYTGPSSNASFGAAVAQLNLDPQVVTPIHTFTEADPDGIWSITLGSTEGPVVVSVRFVNLADHRPVLLGPLQYSLDGGNLSVSARANLAEFYDQEVCAASRSSGAPIEFALPRDMGELGSITLSPGTPFGISTLGVLQPISFWFELYHTYALDEGGTANFVADTLMVAQSQPLDVTSDGPTSTTLTWSAPLRAGRYDLRIYFQNSTSVEAFQSRVLILNESSWLSLSTACLPQQVLSSGISYSGSLKGGQSGWPRTLYYMYRTSGVEAVAAYPLRANISSVSLEASPWNASLQDVQVSVTHSSGVLQTSQEGGSLFVLASQYPAQLNYSLDIGGAPGVAQGALTAAGPYSIQTLKVTLAELTVHLPGGQGSPVALQVSGSRGVNVSRAVPGSNVTASFFLPTGSYTVTASQAGESQSAHIDLTDGAAGSVALNFSAYAGLETVLAVTAAIAVVANILVLAFRRRGARSGLVKRAKR
ncbi:MAG TPA: hypothetical protein VGS04_00740 [Nitrososphaerales archaeon]|nr:hypothetical protein [Nitrososphaerales archaeon]